MLKNHIIYFPGCANSYDPKTKIENIFRALDIDIKPVSEWNCCGAPPSHYKPDFFNKAVMPLRNLGLCQNGGENFLYSGCSVCVNQINESVKLINSDSMFRKQADYSLRPFNAMLKESDPSKTGAIHIIDIIADAATEDKLLKTVPSKIKGNSILLYVGCYKNEAKIESLKKIFNIMGAEVNIFNDCCGGEKLQNMTPIHSKRIENANIADNFFKLINKKADETNSDYIVTVCSMCEKNIDDGMKLSDLDIFAPVIGLVEFIGYILDIDDCGELLNYISRSEVESESLISEECRL
ncbi:MAG: hypothetical protein EVJ48_03655 [Candidatus Acidulodesulfobacterium acidiphilum]|uniref:Cysteine-rich domain-containing protein n=1 Tax=Candidatus Acidulodesulfobacterium acidiphilum TaxID=2597224 RepID=A0A520XF21_9DELT|nr:MAG: hypothetical protein EVJ48_03655 [Candidatus Acidulodesulfobacterium acidiphilum]